MRNSETMDTKRETEKYVFLLPKQCLLQRLLRIASGPNQHFLLGVLLLLLNESRGKKLNEEEIEAVHYRRRLLALRQGILYRVVSIGYTVGS